MAAGPIATGAGDEHWPLHKAVAALASLAGETVRIDGGPGGLLVIHSADSTLAANLGALSARFGDEDLPSMDFAIAGAHR